mgnify:CR=1 FL=1
MWLKLKILLGYVILLLLLVLTIHIFRKEQTRRNSLRQDEHELEMKEKMMEKIVMHKIPDLLKLGITLENACEFAKISVEEYEEYKNKHVNEE